MNERKRAKNVPEYTYTRILILTFLYKIVVNKKTFRIIFSKRVSTGDGNSMIKFYLKQNENVFCFMKEIFLHSTYGKNI